jgi:predicted nucleic acid-binding protein
LKLVVDASSLINLTKAGALAVVLGLEGFTFSIGPLVENECGPDDPEVSAAIVDGSIARLDDDALSANAFTNLLELYDLGDGETECLAFADSDVQFVICTDDGAARTAAASRFGVDRVVGSLFLLRECVRKRLLTSEQARALYKVMRDMGGFLPDLAADYFAT